MPRTSVITPPCRPLRRSAHSPRGFTLIELMIVVAIGGVLAALATTGMFALARKERTKAEAVAVRSALLEARNAARTTLNCVRVEVSAQSITATEMLNCTGLDIDGLGTPTGTDATVSIHTFSDLITLQPFSGAVSGSTFFFTPKGGLPYVGAVELEIRESATNQPIYRYRVFPGVGSVTGGPI